MSRKAGAPVRTNLLRIDLQTRIRNAGISGASLRPKRFGTPEATCLLLAVLLLIVFLPPCQGNGRIRVLALLREGRVQSLQKFFDTDPSIEYTLVPARDGMLTDTELRKQIRLYFPRTYQGMLGYDVLMILSARYDLFTTQQDAWMHDAVADGVGGLSGSSLFSQVPGIAEAWTNGLASRAFPNEGVEVMSRGAEARMMSHRIEISEDYPEPILAVFIPLGVENVYALGDSTRLMVAREGSGILAWQVGSFPAREDFLAAWEYGEGRAMATGGKIPLGWFAYPTGISGENPYSPEILSNILYWLAETDLIDDVVVFHRMRSEISLFRTKIAVLVSLRDFVEKFGARTERIDEEMGAIEEQYSLMVAACVDHNFEEGEAALVAGLERLSQADEVAKRVKEGALLWVYTIEWLVFFSTFFVSGFLTWSLMVRRRLYRSVVTTRLSGSR